MAYYDTLYQAVFIFYAMCLFFKQLHGYSVFQHIIKASFWPFNTIATLLLNILVKIKWKNYQKHLVLFLYKKMFIIAIIAIQYKP